jgi:hypothetical protein
MANRHLVSAPVVISATKPIVATARPTWCGDTVVIFVADHGKMAGERAMWFKSSFFDRGTCRHGTP